MDISVFPTKGNLMNAQNTLALSRQGYELLDKKRNILIREMMLLIDEANEVQSHIDETFMEAYSALQDANVMMGISTVEQVSYAVETVEDHTIRHRSVRGSIFRWSMLRRTDCRAVMVCSKQEPHWILL